jgi:ERF superfamily
MWSTSDETDQVIPAFVAAVGELSDPIRNRIADTGSYSYRYTELSEVTSSTRAVLAKHDLCVTQAAPGENGQINVYTRIWHTSGQWIDAPPLTLNAGSTAQATGSAVTYGRRYALMAFLGLAPDDDDAQAVVPGPRVGKGQPCPEDEDDTVLIASPVDAGSAIKPRHVSQARERRIARLKRDLASFAETVAGQRQLIESIVDHAVPGLLEDSITTQDLNNAEAAMSALKDGKAVIQFEDGEPRIVDLEES